MNHTLLHIKQQRLNLKKHSIQSNSTQKLPETLLLYEIGAGFL